MLQLTDHKTEAVLLTSRITRLETITIRVGDWEIQSSTHLKYLAVHLYQRFTFKEHIKFAS